MCQDVTCPADWTSDRCSSERDGAFFVSGLAQSSWPIWVDPSGLVHPGLSVYRLNSERLQARETRSMEKYRELVLQRICSSTRQSHVSMLARERKLVLGTEPKNRYCIQYT